jgi:hypothetical protein
MYRQRQLALVVDDWMNVYDWSNGRQEKTEVFVDETPIPVTLIVSQIQRGFSWH